MRIDIEEINLDELTRTLTKMPGLFRRARISALKSTGYLVQQEVRNHVEYGGTGWPALHPLTLKFRKKRGVGTSQWSGRRRGDHQTALFWLGKFARYRVDDDGTVVQIDFGKSRKGQPGTVDPQLMPVVKRAEEGETIAVTEKMRRFFGATRRKRPKRQIPGETYFPLKKSTTKIEIPPRPIFSPVWKKVHGRIPAHFKDRFYRSVDRQITGKDNKI
jgi:hypothetical protein